MTEMHELEQAWNGLARRLDAQDAALRRLQHREVVDSVRARLRLVTLGQVAQLAVGTLVVLWAGGYWVGHLGEPHLVVYGLALHVYGLGLLIAAAVQLSLLARLDYRAPVLEVQRRLVAVRRLRIRSERALLMAGFIAWVPLVFVAAHAAGIDVWVTRPGIVLANLAAGIGLSALVAWLTHRFRAWFEHDAAGRSLREIEAELAELEQA